LKQTFFCSVTLSLNKFRSFFQAKDAMKGLFR
jgi:hypothetical protein